MEIINRWQAECNRWRSERRRRQGIVEDLLAQADQASRQAWVDRAKDEATLRRLDRMIREADDDR